MVQGNTMLEDNPVMDYHRTRGSRNTPSHLMLQKPEQAQAVWET